MQILIVKETTVSYSISTFSHIMEILQNIFLNFLSIPRITSCGFGWFRSLFPILYHPANYELCRELCHDHVMLCHVSPAVTSLSGRGGDRNLIKACSQLIGQLLLQDTQSCVNIRTERIKSNSSYWFPFNYSDQ